jgi:hypothetical protein
MAKHYGDYVQDKDKDKRRRVAFHEAGHIELAKTVAPKATIHAFVDDFGGGKTKIDFPSGTTRRSKFVVAVAGFLGEAKGSSGKTLSEDFNHARTLAMEIARGLGAGEDAFQVDVFMTDGEPEPSTTNKQDFKYALDDPESQNFRIYCNMLYLLPPLTNEIQDAIFDCIARLNTGDLWGAVGGTAAHILEHGWYSKSA